MIGLPVKILVFALSLTMTPPAVVDREMPGVPMAVLPLSQPCGDQARGPDDRVQVASSPNAAPVTSGSWSHVEPPRSLPKWLGDCGGFTGLFAYGQPSPLAASG